MSRRNNGPLRCPRCRVHGSLCVCALIAPIATRTRVVLLLHSRESWKTTNTGRLATLCLPNSEVIVRGEAGRALPPAAPWDAASRPLLLFPDPDALPLRSFAASDAPVTLVVPDGTWRQAAKARNRVPWLRDLPCVGLEAGEPSTYRLRNETHEEGLATIEAIARALEILEGPAVRASLDRVFRAMVERTLWSSGRIATADVTSGIPAGAQRHDPRSGIARQRG